LPRVEPTAHGERAAESGMESVPEFLLDAFR